MTKTKRSLIMSVLVLLLCIAAVAGGTYALFSDDVNFDQTLQAGTLDITLIRTKLVTTKLDNDTGFLVSNADNPDTRRLDFSGKPPENVFGIKSTDKIVPCTSYEATFDIENHSDVAFGYWIEVVCEAKDKAAAKELADQLRITVNTDNKAFIGDGLIVKGSEGGNFIKVLPKKGTDTFTVKIEFLDSHNPDNKIADNNFAKNQKLDFHLSVRAIQVTSDPSAPPANQQPDNQQPPANP